MKEIGFEHVLTSDSNATFEQGLMKTGAFYCVIEEKKIFVLTLTVCM